MEVFYTVIFSILGLIIILSLVGFLLPKTSHVERSIVIKKPKEEVFAHINNLKKWVVWSPWSERDPDMSQTFSGPEEGKGAQYEWKGNRKVGQGKMQILESQPFDYVRWNLQFGHNNMPTTASFKLEEQDGTTKVTWSFDAELSNNPTSRYMGIMMKGFIGNDYEKGLENLKNLMESVND